MVKTRSKQGQTSSKTRSKDGGARSTQGRKGSKRIEIWWVGVGGDCVVVGGGGGGGGGGDVVEKSVYVSAFVFVSVCECVSVWCLCVRLVSR